MAGTGGDLSTIPVAGHRRFPTGQEVDEVYGSTFALGYGHISESFGTWSGQLVRKS